MSVSAILNSATSSNLFEQTRSIQSNQQQQFQQEFQQLGKDLQTGNLSAAQADFATLQQSGNVSTSPVSASGSNPIAQAFNQLAQDLQSGNISAAQQDYTNLQKDLQSNGPERAFGHHRHPHALSGSSGSSEVNQVLQQLGQDLQSNNLAGAQQAYQSLLKDFSPATTGGVTAQSPASSTVSVSA